MKWEVVIGIETHTQLSTLSKIFSGSSTAFGAAPNTQASAVDLALPGVLPVMNRGAVERAIKLGLAVGGHIASHSVMARKNYFYPDLPKGYQISQMELPIVQGGSITIQVEGKEKIVRLTRAHLEEDAGKSLHEDFHGATGIDLNRAGTPLLEIVSEPDMRSAAEAVAYAKALHSLVRWIGICDGNMQEGSFRCDANVSVRPLGEEKLGTRCEIKNINSFRFIEKAIEYEVKRQIELIEDGGKVIQQTRLYDPDKDETRAMRSKEDAHDYRYFPDPDLLPLAVSDAWIAEVRSKMPELPQAMRERYARDYAVTAYDAGVLTSSREMAQYFEATVKAGADAKMAANWIGGEISARLNKTGHDITDCPVPPVGLAQLIKLIADGTISVKIAKEMVLPAMWSVVAGNFSLSDPSSTLISYGPSSPLEIVKNLGLEQISDVGAIEKAVDAIIAANARQVAEYRAGKEKAFGYFVGQAMKAMGGKANPAQLNEILKRKLQG